jgi:Skp family chaperone for outer membrane proteins
VRSPAALAIVLLAAAVFLAPSYAARFAPPAHPAIIASIDLEKVFNEIDRRATAEAGLEQMAEQFRLEAERLRDIAEQAKMDMELLVPGTDKYEAAQDAWTQAVLEYQASTEFFRKKLDAKRAEARKTIYREIVEEAAGFAQANGVDYIVADDSGMDLLEGSDLQIVQQMSLRRLVYANPSYDVTEDLIAWINQN